MKQLTDAQKAVELLKRYGCALFVESMNAWKIATGYVYGWIKDKTMQDLIHKNTVEIFDKTGNGYLYARLKEV